MTIARWYGGHAAVPSVRSFSSKNRMSARRVQQRLGLLEQVALVRRAAALGHEQELVRVAVGRVDLDLAPAGCCRCSPPRTCRAAPSASSAGSRSGRCRRRRGDRGFVAAAGEHELALLAHHDRGAGVLARRQDAAGRDARVLAAARARRTGRWATPRGRRGSPRSCARWPGRRRCAMSRIASAVSSVSASGSTSRNLRPAASNVDTSSVVSRR